jgi:glycosyltransferase involved in cell wall biosynthesis
MKNFAIFLFLMGVVFCGTFVFARNLDKRGKIIVAAPAEKTFQPAPFALTNHPFTLVVIGYNNGASVAKTLSSIFSQNYENYRVIYIDDASDDGSYDLARDLIYDSAHLGQITLVHNETKLGALANMVRAVATCQNDEIVAVLQGEDWLAHEWVLQRLNAYYADSDLWLTYGQYRDFPTYQIGACQPIKERKLRSQPFNASHLKTFYAGLFKKIKESDFIFSGQFLDPCADLAYMIPMLEMAKDHYHFISEILYISNRYTASKEDRESQMRCEKFIRSLDPYAPLQVHPCGE